MVPIVTISQMKALEQSADKKGHTYAQMMQKAGLGLANLVQERFAYLEEKRIMGLVGSGNNGGDTLVALTALQKQGWQTSAYLAKARDEADEVFTTYRDAGGEVLLAEEDKGWQKLETLLKEKSMLLDGIFGTGIQLPLKKGIAVDILKKVKHAEDKPYVVAVDCPSGIDCDSGQAAAETIPAQWTISMVAVKQGMLAMPAFGFSGEIDVVDIGLDKVLGDWGAVNRQMVRGADVKAVLPARPLDAHKGSFGTALIVAGSVNYIGAAYLAGKAAYRVGAGLVKMAVLEVVQAAIAGQLPEAVWVLLPENLGVISKEAVRVLIENMDRVSAMLLGPGWGREDETGIFLEELMQAGPKMESSAGMGFVGKKSGQKRKREGLPPLVLDADALKLLAKIPRWKELLPKQTILTPHPGEMAVLTGMSVKEIQADRQAVAEKFAKQWGCVVVLKGALSVIADPSGKSAIIPVATSALAKAGTGDVLAGMTVGLLAQGLDAFQAAWAAAWMHAKAGLKALDYTGHTAAVLASDVLEMIPEILSDF